MNAAIERADAFLAEAKHGINTGTLTTAEIEDYIATARRIIRKARTDRKLDLLEQAGQAALSHLENLESIRRLCVYGITHGRVGREAIEFCKLMETQPPLDAAKGLPAFTARFEWLQANRRRLANLVANIQPNREL